MGLTDIDAAETQSDFEHLTIDWKPVFVTSIASNHFKEGRKLIKLISDHYPDSKIVVYDIGLKQSDVSVGVESEPK